ncbi:MAG: HAMP domain-containing histidine kinase [Psychrobium sp.]|nr:HAMP domain-containing histidine kinase [Psychrobium sp.]
MKQCHSGELLAKNLDEPRLNRVFGTISRRVNHLNEFIKGYATLTKIKLPNKTIIHWPSLIEQLQSMYAFELTSELALLENDVFGDISQLEQVLINILKNAHEADPSGQVSIAIAKNAHRIRPGAEP